MCGYFWVSCFVPLVRFHLAAPPPSSFRPADLSAPSSQVTLDYPCAVALLAICPCMNRGISPNRKQLLHLYCSFLRAAPVLPVFGPPACGSDAGGCWKTGSSTSVTHQRLPRPGAAISRTGLSRTEPSRTEPSRTRLFSLPRPGFPRPGSPEPEPSRTGLSRTEPSRTETSRTGLSRTGPSRQALQDPSLPGPGLPGPSLPGPVCFPSQTNLWFLVSFQSFLPEPQEWLHGIRAGSTRTTNKQN